MTTIKMNTIKHLYDFLSVQPFYIRLLIGQVLADRDPSTVFETAYKARRWEEKCGREDNIFVQLLLEQDLDTTSYTDMVKNFLYVLQEKLNAFTEATKQ